MALSSLNNFEFSAAIRGFHIYHQVWQPERDETLICSHEAGNAFDSFAIKATNRHGVISGHLPREISRPSKYLLDRGASMTATLTDTHYRQSPLFQGGLEIPCLVKVQMPSTKLASNLMGRYREMVERLYVEPEHPVIVACYLEKEPMQPLVQPTPRAPVKKANAQENKNPQRRPGIHFYMLPEGSGPSDLTKAQKKKIKEKSRVIEIDSDSD